MEIRIRKADEHDIPGILRIVNYEIVHTTANYSYQENSLDDQLEWYWKKQEERWPVIVADLNHKVIGFGTYGAFRLKEAYRYSVEHSVYVAKEARGQGIGQMLLKELIQLALQQSYHTMIAGVDSSNQGSYAFHQRMGFKEVGRFSEVGYKFDRWLDLILMQLLLREE
uniref:GNAT family N-acetyltransferase n=1 Tax=Roseihalotalea indica TaxID=2867963 RepID=A0AA49GNW0_9BACT|nr:GNAT family N-acetyltransferase [Tunicatimonas sp. TK19036]